MNEIRRIMRRPQVLKTTGFSNSHIYRLMGEGKFPKPFKLVPGGSAIGWFEDEIADYIEKRAAARDQQALEK